MNGIRDEMTGILTSYGNISFSFIFFLLKNRKEEGMGVAYINIIIIIIIINNNNK
jgi:hypothetical protein